MLMEKVFGEFGINVERKVDDDGVCRVKCNVRMPEEWWDEFIHHLLEVAYRFETMAVLSESATDRLMHCKMCEATKHLALYYLMEVSRQGAKLTQTTAHLEVVGRIGCPFEGCDWRDAVKLILGESEEKTEEKQGTLR